jgi:hypothetical protein
LAAQLLREAGDFDLALLSSLRHARKVIPEIDRFLNDDSPNWETNYSEFLSSSQNASKQTQPIANYGDTTECDRLFLPMR